MASESTFARFVAMQVRFVTFRSTPFDAARDLRPFLALGLLATWIAGLGRYWDHANADWWQYAGLGSVAYVFVLSGVLWLVGWPLRIRSWSYGRVLLFVCLTSPLAWAYAIPVERFLSADGARAANAWFLGIVALWRVLLLLVFWHRACGLDAAETATVSLLPVTAIISVLSWLNLEHATFALMGGMREVDRTPHDAAYAIVWTLSVFSLFLFPISALVYFALVAARRRVGRSDP